MLPTFTIFPFPFATICGTTAWISITGPAQSNIELKLPLTTAIILILTPISYSRYYNFSFHNFRIMYHMSAHKPVIHSRNQNVRTTCQGCIFCQLESRELPWCPFRLTVDRIFNFLSQEPILDYRYCKYKHIWCYCDHKNSFNFRPM